MDFQQTQDEDTNLSNHISLNSLRNMDAASLSELDKMYFDDLEIANRENYNDSDENLIDVLEIMHPTTKH